MSEMAKKVQLYFAFFVIAFIVVGSIFAPLLVTHNPFERQIACKLLAGNIFLVQMLWDVTCSAEFCMVVVRQCC